MRGVCEVCVRWGSVQGDALHASVHLVAAVCNLKGSIRQSLSVLLPPVTNFLLQPGLMSCDLRCFSHRLTDALAEPRLRNSSGELSHVEKEFHNELPVQQNLNQQNHSKLLVCSNWICWTSEAPGRSSV